MKKPHLKILLLLIFTFSLNIHSQKVMPAENLLEINRQTVKPSENALEFNGQLHHHVNHGIFWKPGETYGVFFWEAWVKPYPDAQYVISDGYGGAHALLFGFDGNTDELALSGNISDYETNNVVSFGTNETVPVNQWCHIAVGWDGQKIVTYINGFPSGIVPYSGKRITSPSSGAGVLFVGGSDHNNFNGKIARIRGFEGKIPLDNLLSSFKPEKYFRSSYLKSNGEIITPSFLVDYSTPANSIADLSLGFNGINHIGILGNYTDTGLFGRLNKSNGSLPVWKNDPITPPVYMPTTPTIPANAIVYDSFSRANSDPAFGGVGLGKVEMPSANWQGTYVADWGIYNKRALDFGSSVSPIYVETGTANMKVQVTRLLGSFSSSEIGLVYRYENDQNFGFAYSSNGAIYLVEVVNGVYALTQSGVPQANWLKLSVVANENSVKVYTDFNLIITAASNNLLTATKAGLLGSTGTGERFDDFAVYPPQ